VNFYIKKETTRNSLPLNIKDAFSCLDTEMYEKLNIYPLITVISLTIT